MTRLYQPILAAAPAGAMDIGTYIEHIEAFEKKYPADKTNTPKLVTRIRKIYYGEESWDKHLIQKAKGIPAPYTIKREKAAEESVMLGLDVVRYRVTPHEANGEIPVLFNGQSLRLKDASYLDIGHVFAGLDALQHPQLVDGPFSVNITNNADAVTWVGDLGSVQAEAQLKLVGNNSKPISESALQLIINEYASPEDMLGNIDAYVIQKYVVPGKMVSAILRAYYLESNTDYLHRYSLFAEKIGLKWDGKAFSNYKDWLEKYTDEVNDSAALYLGLNTTSPVLLQYPAAVGMSMNPGAQFLLLLFLEALKTRICHEPK